MRLIPALFPALAVLAMPLPVMAQEVAGTSAEQVRTDEPALPNLDGGSSYGQFLAGRAAMNRGDGEAATAFLARALAESGGARLVRERTFSAAILAGEIRVAAAVPLAAGESHAAIVEARRLAEVTQAIVDGRSRAVHREIQAHPVQAPHLLAGRLLHRWLAASANDWDVALAPTSTETDALTQILGGYYRALLLERRRQYDEAEAQYQALLMDGAAAAMTRLPYGEFLERRGRRDEAIAIYDAGLSLGADSSLTAARARAASRGRPPALISVQKGAALAFGHAAAAAAISEVHEFVVAYLRMSLALDPDNGESWLMLGDALNEMGMSATAREAWGRTPTGTPQYAEAQIQIAASLDEDGYGEEAVRVARAVADGQPGPNSAFTLAVLLTSHNQLDAALDVLDGPALADVDAWNVAFHRGVIHERSGDFEAAETAFQRALELSPDQPDVLNYLGYMWVDRGVRLEEGLALIERAVAAGPENGNFQDSLGWAYYRMGRFDEAVTVLERAIGLEPGSATINDHLGDAYWQVGRRREAQYQWQRALGLDPEDDERQAIEAKLGGTAPTIIAAAIP
ncbi:MAG: tetratricopeptide repeat protein [Caulobacterales bacterium]|nr:tetratricopeptide repeat protein [Caulobacterales bacterium]